MCTWRDATVFELAASEESDGSVKVVSRAVRSWEALAMRHSEDKDDEGTMQTDVRGAAWTEELCSSF